MKGKKSSLTSRHYPSHNLFVVGKLEHDSTWKTTIDENVLPVTVFFQISGIPETFDTIKKIGWTFGDTPKVSIITNKYQQPEFAVVKHPFKKIDVNITTLAAQASVYTDVGIFITPEFELGPFKNKTKQNYVDPVQFKNQIVEFYKTKNLSDTLAISVQEIANRLAFAPNFINYTYREEMVGDAIIKMIKALREKKFIPKKGNPFSYFTKIAFHAFCNRIKKEKKERETITNYQEDVYNVLVENRLMSSQKIQSTGSDEDF